ncbi:transposase [Comamonas endophytica]|uniref:transposase n=1 Tax=Comamonas endophytica TaxID=2949090 RepID=UPI003612C31A
MPRTLRTCAPQFKAELITACLQPGASIAVAAHEHGLNANVLYRWLEEHWLSRHQIACDMAPAS